MNLFVPWPDAICSLFTSISLIERELWKLSFKNYARVTTCSRSRRSVRYWIFMLSGLGSSAVTRPLLFCHIFCKPKKYCPIVFSNSGHEQSQLAQVTSILPHTTPLLFTFHRRTISRVRV